MTCAASHQVDSGLPCHLMDSYVRYKKSTYTIIQWLIKHGACGQRLGNSVSVNMLKELAWTVKQRSIAMTVNIAYAFRETIEERSRLSRFFRWVVKAGKDDDVEHTGSLYTRTRIESCG